MPEPERPPFADLAEYLLQAVIAYQQGVRPERIRTIRKEANATPAWKDPVWATLADALERLRAYQVDAGTTLDMHITPDDVIDLLEKVIQMLRNRGATSVEPTDSAYRQ